MDKQINELIIDLQNIIENYKEEKNDYRRKKIKKIISYIISIYILKYFFNNDIDIEKSFDLISILCYF